MNKISAKHTVLSKAVAMSSPIMNAKNSISADGELLLYGVIGDWWDGLDAQTIVSQLEQFSGNEIVVRINSPGGSVVEGLAMYNRLKQSSKRVVVYIDGMAASMGCAIAMAADHIYIPSNALMMMHKPSVDYVGGNEMDLRDIADELKNLEASYIQLHVDKTGKAFEEIEALIADGKNHYFRGQDAIDYGLADSLIETVALSAAACAQFKALDIPAPYQQTLFNKTAAAAAKPQEDDCMWLKIKAKRGGWHYVPAVSAALTGSFSSVEEAVAELKGALKIDNVEALITGKTECDVETLEAMAAHFGLEPNVANNEPATPTVSGAQAVQDERNRVKDLRAIAAQASIDDAELNDWIDSGVQIAEARAKALDAVANRDAQFTPTASIRTGGHVGAQGMRAAMVNAMLNRAAPGRYELTEDGRDFRGMQLADMVSASLEAAGATVRGRSRSELVAMAMNTTSDFPLILQDVANKTLRDAYAEAPVTYKMVAAQSSASDFKAKHSLQLGGGSALEKVNESGEFENGTVSESGESYKLETYGKIFNFTRQLLINDDLSALTRFMAQIGRAAGRKENALTWGLVKSNPSLAKDGPVYSTGAARKNQFSGTGITETELSAGRKLLRQMKGLDGEVLNVLAKYLVVGSERETAAQKILGAIQPDSATSFNPFAKSMEHIVEPLLDGVANNPWYLFADPSDAPVLEYCYLDGEAGPYLETKWGFETDGMSLKVRHDFGVGFVDFRGSAKCTGA